jgi:hypothetical protein
VLVSDIGMPDMGVPDMLIAGIASLLRLIRQ